MTERKANESIRHFAVNTPMNIKLTGSLLHLNNKSNVHEKLFTAVININFMKVMIKID